MNVRSICPWALVALVLGAGVARAQVIDGPPGGVENAPASAPLPGVAPESMLNTPADRPAPGRLSSWITYNKPDCCGPIGRDGPIKMEIYVQSGISIPVEGAYFGHTLDTGWVIQGGGRSLFYNPEGTRAWVVDLSLSNIDNHGQRSDLKATLRNPIVNGTRVATQLISVQSMDRTFVNLGIGHDWYLAGSALHNCRNGCASGQCNDGAWNWRVGIDAGGRLGSERLELNEIPHRTDAISGLFAGLTSDLEIPCGCCTFLAGFRAEWGYTFSSILQRQNDSELQDVNILFNVGLRY
jgi:hypothetical protein